MRTMMKVERNQVGYTLVELMIVVSMIAIMAALAVAGYRKYVLASETSEAKAVIQGIRGAEEVYKAEMLTYLSCSTTLKSYYPMTDNKPNDKKWNWVNPKHADYKCWQLLNVVTDGPVRFGYSVVAGLSGEEMPKADAFTSPPAWPKPTASWYVVQAATDRDGNGKYALFLASSGNGSIYYEEETE